MAATRDFLFPHLLLWQLMIKMCQRQPPESLVGEPYCTSIEITRNQQIKYCNELPEHTSQYNKTAIYMDNNRRIKCKYS